MKKTPLIRKCLISMSLIAILGCISGASIAWFHSQDNVDFTKAIDGTSNGAYYASGNGTEESPYEINRPIHLYNLAWLQYSGKYNTDEDKDGNFDNFYFYISADLDMSGYVLPPIGTTDNPFVGHFDGQNHTVSNLTISNTFSDFETRHPITVTDASFVSPEIIGFFGIVGLLPSKYKEYSYSNATASSVTQLYLDNITVENNSTNGTLAGFLAGYVNTTITNCGVHYCDFELKSGTTNISDLCDDVSKYSYIGAINSTDYKIDGDTSGTEAGDDYGTSTNLRQLYEDIESLSDRYSDLKDDTVMLVPKDYAFPFRRYSSVIVSPKYSTLSMQISSSSTSNITSYNYFEAATSNNIGYYIGSDIKIYHKTGVDYSTINQYTIGTIAVTLSDDELEKIKTYLTETHTNSDGTTYRQGDYLLRLTGVTSTFNISSSLAVIESGKVGKVYSGTMLLPYRCVWVAPTKAGKFTFVMVSESNNYSYAADVACVFKFSRSTKNNYSSYMYDGYSSTNTDSYLLAPMRCTSKVTSVTFDVSQTDIDNKVEYAIGVQNDYRSNNTPYIAYMDIGASDGSSEPTDDRTALTVDFVWAATIEDVLSLIKITDTGYVKSQVFLAVATSDTNTANSKFCYKRIKPTNEDQTNAFTSFVYYYQADSNSLVIRDDGKSAAIGHAIEKDSESVVKNA